MKVTSLTIIGGIKRSREFQSADASFEVTVSLDAGENPKQVYREVYHSLMGVVQDEAQRALEDAIQTRREVEGI